MTYNMSNEHKLKIGKALSIEDKIPKDLLFRIYITENKSIRDTAKILHIAHTTVLKYLNKYEIPIRSVSEGKKGRPVHSQTEETKRKISEYRSINFVGDKSPCYKGGKRLSQKRMKARRRVLGFTPLNEPFEGCQGHHIDKEHIIFIPEELHKSIPHALKRPESMEEINTRVFNWILGIY